MHLSSFINIPPIVPVMTLPEMVLFPQTTAPLFIFEERYRQMLADTLDADRLFAIATARAQAADPENDLEPFHPIGCVGLIRNCQRNPDGTSLLALQGVARVRILGVESEEPYRRIRIEVLESIPCSVPEGESPCHQLLALLEKVQESSQSLHPQLMQFLRGLEDPETLVDLAADCAVQDPRARLRLLSEAAVPTRMKYLCQLLRRKVSDLEMGRSLRGDLSDEQVEGN